MSGAPESVHPQVMYIIIVFVSYTQLYTVFLRFIAVGTYFLSWIAMNQPPRTGCISGGAAVSEVGQHRVV